MDLLPQVLFVAMALGYGSTALLALRRQGEGADIEAPRQEVSGCPARAGGGSWR